jgi:hypothetical protein
MIGGMRNTLKFWWYCVVFAWRGCWTRAYEQAGVLGAIILWVVLWLVSPYLRELGLIEAPTTYWGVAGFAAASAGASVLLSFLVIFLTRLVLAPAGLYWEQRRRADALDEDLRTTTAKAEGRDEGPNWPIHELFSLIEPDVLDRPEDNLWEKAGDQIRDALALGRLRSWGRLCKTELGEWVGERAALRQIDKTYWYKAYFTYSFFDETASDAAHCYADRTNGTPAYTDLQVNRGEALKLWPGEPDDFSDSYPNVRIADTPAIIDLFRGSERPKLIGLLGSERLTSWARVSANIPSDHVVLDGKIWGSHSFKFIPKRDDPGTINQTYLHSSREGTSSHYDICLNYAQLKRVWPQLPMRRSKCDVM